MKATAILTPLFRAHALSFCGALALSLLTLLVGIALLGVSGWFLTAAALTTMAVSFNLFGPSSLIRGRSLLRILSRYGEKLVGHDATLRLLSDLRTSVFGRMFTRLSPSHGDISHGDLVSRVTADIDALDAIFIVGIAPLAISLLSGVVMAIVIGAILPQALLAYCLAVGCAVIVVPALLFVSCRRLGSEQVANSADARNQLLNALDGHADLIAFGRIESTEREFFEACDRLGKTRSGLALRVSLAAMAIQLLTATCLIAILINGIAAFEGGALGAPVLVGLLLATLASFEGALAIVRGVARFCTALAAASRIGELAEAEPTIQHGRFPMPRSNRLTLDHVSFAYDQAKPILRKLTLCIDPGERVALVGRSGCGKSTLLSMLVGLVEAQAGEIKLGGVDLVGLDGDEVRGRIALLAQDAPVFMGTIRDNLLIGDPWTDDGRLMEILDSVRLGDFVRHLPEGLGTYVGETGRTLSVGQVRRLCLARVLLSKADILLLDEPTSSLDSEMETDFFADLEHISDGRTIVVVTHAPMAVLDGFDRVYKMRSGELVRA